MELPRLRRVHHPYRRGERRRKPFPPGQEAISVCGVSFFQGYIPGALHAEARGVVLLVEPEAPLRWRLGNALVQRGYSVVEAATAAQAAELLAEVTFDVLLVDLDLPSDAAWVLLRALAGGASLTTPLIVLPARQYPGKLINDLPGLPQPTWLEDLLRLVERIRPGKEGLETSIQAREDLFDV